jgi:RHS repeat-associated protein
MTGTSSAKPPSPTPPIPNSPNPKISVTHNIWTLDLSDTLQGAGGVGGLLLTLYDITPYFPIYDANGNITAYANAYGAITAHYDYDAFGNIVTQSGELADNFIHRFSSKPWCNFTGILHYQRRPYLSSLGRWLSRDPIAEGGGINLYGFCRNNPVLFMDLFGETVTPNEYNEFLDKKERPWTGVTIHEPEIKCESCNPHQPFCLRAQVKQETGIEMQSVYSSTKWKEHEHKHAEYAYNAVDLMEFYLHLLADDQCVEERCCWAKQAVLKKAIKVAQAERYFRDNALDCEDYPFYNLEKRQHCAALNPALGAWGSANNALKEEINNLRKHCEKKIKP